MYPKLFIKHKSIERFVLFNELQNNIDDFDQMKSRKGNMLFVINFFIL